MKYKKNINVMIYANLRFLTNIGTKCCTKITELVIREIKKSHSLQVTNIIHKKRRV